MRVSHSEERSDRLLWSGIVLASACIGLALVTCGVFAHAEVLAGEQAGRRQCGSVLDPNAETSVCATALRERSWKAAGLLGVALFGAVGAVVIAGSDPSKRARRLMAVAVAVGVVVFAGALIWAGVIDRTVGT